MPMQGMTPPSFNLKEGTVLGSIIVFSSVLSEKGYGFRVKSLEFRVKRIMTGTAVDGAVAAIF
jgi:hypothetical protein